MPERASKHPRCPKGEEERKASYEVELDQFVRNKLGQPLGCPEGVGARDGAHHHDRRSSASTPGRISGTQKKRPAGVPTGRFNLGA